MEILNEIQKRLNAPKDQYNSFGKYSYRSAEGIMEAVKPLLGDSILTVSDEVVEVGNRIYIKATATIKNKDGEESTTAYAREPEIQKGMNEAQITGSTSSYARKYALNGLFAIDDTKDADATNTHGKTETNTTPVSTVKKVWLNYEDCLDIIEAGNTTEKQIANMIKEDGYSLSANAKIAIRDYLETGELKKDLFFKAK